MASSVPLAFPALLGVIVHHGLFIRGEWHLRAPSIVVVHTLAFLALLAHRLSDSGVLTQRLLEAVFPTAAYLTGLLGSISIYRLFFHGLRGLPGPRLAALSKLWHVWKCRYSHGHHVLEEWHHKYGDTVRTGPNEVTLFHPAAFEVLDGPGNRNSRSDWYDLILPRISSIFTRDRQLHKGRRKIWEQIMAPALVNQYHDRILEKVRALNSMIRESGTQPVHVNEMIYWFAFDSMGSFGFGLEFDLMKNKKSIDGYLNMRSALGLLGPFTPAIWIARLGFAFIPGLWRVRHWFKMLEFSDTCMDACMTDKPEDKSKPAYIASAFIQDYRKNEGVKINDRLLSGDGANLLVAASDSTAPSIIFLLYFLARYPEHANRIREELVGIDCEDIKTLATLPHLNGTINEALRLLPAILTAVSRKVPPEGLTVDGVFIPGGTKICAPRYSIGRSEKAFVNAQEFIPERWYSKPELVKASRAFAPFGMGRTLCVGKNLAMVQMRLVAARLLNDYHFKFALGEGNGEAVERDLKDQLTASPGKLNLVFEKR